MALDAQQQQDYADFLRRYQEDPGSITPDEAAQRYRELMSLASSDEAAEAHDQAQRSDEPRLDGGAGEVGVVGHRLRQILIACRPRALNRRFIPASCTLA